MSKPQFVYVTYIRTTAEQLWHALTDPDFNRQYWFGMHQRCDWKKGASWQLVFADGRVADSGEVVEIDAPHRLVLKWRNEFRPELKADGYTYCTFDVAPDGEMTKLTVRHEADKPHKLMDAVSQGWPQVLSSLKSLLETDRALPRAEQKPQSAAQFATA